MAAITTAAAVTAGASLLSSGVQMYQGAKDKRAARKALENLQVPELENAFEDIEISTIGSDLIKEEAQRTTGGLIELAQSGGIRGVMGAIPGIQALNNTTNEQARKYLDDQVLNREYAIADDNARIRQMKEQRYQGELQGIGQQMMVGNQNMWSGIRGIGSSIAYAGRNGLFDSNESS